MVSDSSEGDKPVEAMRTSKLMRGALYVTPVYAVKKAAYSVVSAKDRIKKSFEEFKTALPDYDAGNAGEENAPGAGIEDPFERFEAIYEINKWNEAEILEQMSACQRTKLASLSLSVVAFLGSFVALFFAPLWMLLFVLPVGGCAVILGLVQAFKFSLYQTQLSMRCLISARQFYARNDFFVRLIG